VAPRLKKLSGRDVVRALRQIGFEVQRTRGCHTTLSRRTASGAQTLTVPLHRELAHGTLHAIYRQALKFVAAEDLRPLFFHE
jgi:predicted RNA binding protein YcfA (HicA-like mRNA interferase family)